MNLFTTQEQLLEVEHMIEALRSFENSDEDRHRIRILGSIASDLRGRLGRAPNVALIELERRIAAAVRSKTRLGYANGTMVGIGEELIGRWSTVRQALEKYGATEER